MIGNIQEWILFLKKLSPDNIVKITEIRENRSQRQNRLYHQWLKDIQVCFEEQGIFITHDELHEWLRDKLIPWSYEINPLTSRTIHKKKSTTQLNKKEFSKYIHDCEKYLIDRFEISYPLPVDIFYTKKRTTDQSNSF